MNVRIEVWSDVVCPYCYVGKRKLELALAQTGVAAEIVWHSFELDPTAPRLLGVSLPDMLAAKYRVDWDRALAMVEQQRRAVAEVGLEFNWAGVQRGNTFDAHRLIHLGATRGLADAVTERLMRGYFTEGAAIGDPAALQALAVQAGLDAGEVAAVLAGDAFGADVRADEHRAGQIGVHAVPHFVFDGAEVISGAADVAAFTQVLRQARG